MYLLGYSLNNLSLMALTISTGFVVDDAIVMVENIDRYLEMGDTPLDAALKGSEQIGFTILSLTVSLIAVLIPLLFMGDIVGRLFREFAVTLAVTILVSAVVSLTLTPMMSAKLLKHMPESEKGRFYKVSEDFFNWVIDRYAVGVRFVLRHQTLTLLVTLATFVLTFVLYSIVPKGFFPVQDTGVILAITDAPQDISFSAMSQRQQALANAILQDPDVDSLSSFIGIDATNNTLNSGRIQINLRDREERKTSAELIIRRLTTRLARVEGIQAYMQPLQDLTVENRTARTQYQYSVEDASSTELVEWSNRILAKFRSLPQLADVATDQTTEGLEAALVIDRDTASRLGITPQNIDDTLDDAYAQRQVSTMFTQQNQYHVILEVAPKFQRDPDQLSNIYVKSANGTQVPLSTFTHYEQRSATLAISHQGQFPAVNLSFNLAPGYSIGDAVTAVRRAEKELNMPLSVNANFQGTAASFEASLSNEPLLILAALVTVYIVLGVLYESYIHPITILSTLPSAGVGAILALFITGTNLSVIALIGIILLIGIVKKNAIMMIDFALEAEREHGKTPEESIYQACLLRFRPIMMTTMAALLGGVPLAFGSGTGSELRRPLGITIIGGLIVSQVLTLYTTPVVYLFFDRIGRKVPRHRTGRSRDDATPPRERTAIRSGRLDLSLSQIDPRPTTGEPMNYAPEPGDKQPTDHVRAGDQGKLDGSGLRGGDSDPRDHASPHDEHKNAQPMEGENSPLGSLGGVHFSAPFIQRPIATFLLSFAILLAGAVAYKLLPVASLPNVEFPVISVQASLPRWRPRDDGVVGSDAA